jgi:hypothetical protein
MSRPRAADDFATIRARLEELRRERGEPVAPGELAPNAESDRVERRRRDRLEGLPPPWVPTIFIKQPPV